MGYTHDFCQLFPTHPLRKQISLFLRKRTGWFWAYLKTWLCAAILWSQQDMFLGAVGRHHFCPPGGSSERNSLLLALLWKVLKRGVPLLNYYRYIFNLLHNAWKSSLSLVKCALMSWPKLRYQGHSTWKDSLNTHSREYKHSLWLLCLSWKFLPTDWSCFRKYAKQAIMKVQIRSMSVYIHLQ